MSWLALVIGLVVMAASCAGSSGLDGEDLVWAINGGETAEGGLASDVVKKCNEAPGRPKVRLEALPQSADEQRQLLTVELNAGLSDIDILSLDVVWTGEFAENGWLVDLEGDRGPIERASSPGPFQTATWKGRLWAAPFTTGAGFLYYRRDLLDRRPVPTTWDDLMNVGLEPGRASGIAPFVGQGAQYEGMVVNYLEYFWSAHGELFDRDGTQVLFEEKPALDALSFMRKAREQGFYAPDFSNMKEGDALEAFRSGNAVFMRNWPSEYAKLAEPDSKVAGRVGIAPLPTFGGNSTVSALGGYNLGVSRFSRHQRMAKEFVMFVSTSQKLQSDLALRMPHPRPSPRSTARTPCAKMRSCPCSAASSRPRSRVRPRRYGPP